jgi:hypothetical protein
MAPSSFPGLVKPARRAAKSSHSPYAEPPRGGNPLPLDASKLEIMIDLQ